MKAVVDLWALRACLLESGTSYRRRKHFAFSKEASKFFQWREGNWNYKPSGHHDQAHRG